jgi:hypothetical protein
MHTFTLFVKHHFEGDSVKVCVVFDENLHFIALRSCWTRPSGISAQNVDFVFVCDWHCLSCIMSLSLKAIMPFLSVCCVPPFCSLRSKVWAAAMHRWEVVHMRGLRRSQSAASTACFWERKRGSREVLYHLQSAIVGIDSFSIPCRSSGAS